MAVSWTKAEREKAKTEGRCLFALVIHTKTSPTAKLGDAEYLGLCNDAEAQQIMNLITKICAENSKKTTC